VNEVPFLRSNEGTFLGFVPFLVDEKGTLSGFIPFTF